MEQQLIDYLRPYKINSPKIRLGPPEDGGYVTSQISLERSNSLFTYGVGNDTRFEEDYVKRYPDKPAYLFDHTIDGIHPVEGLYFRKEGLGFKENCMDFILHFLGIYKSIGINANAALLKVDIEGDEYNYFPRAEIETLAGICCGIILEVHWLDNADYRESFKKLARALRPYFILTHVHGNSWGSAFNFEGHDIPITWELSYDNRYIVEDLGLDRSEYPVPGLDFSNNPAIPDIPLNYIYG